MDKSLRKKFRAIVGADHFRDQQEDLLSYSYDGTGRESLPDGVIFPASTDEVSAIMKLASEYRVPIVPRGAGSGMTGGAVPVQGGLVMPMVRLNRIREIDVKNQLAVVEPGVITADFQQAVKRKNLYYPPDPASMKFCTMGGNAAECAGGPSAVKYGVTRDYVRGLEVVLADGRLMSTGVRTAKGVVGYDLTRLFIGSEGTLGVITKLTVRLIAQPETKSTLLISVNSMERAAELVADVLEGHLPCTMEYIDKTGIELVKERIPFLLPEKVEALLLVELDGERNSVCAEVRQLQQFFQDSSGVLGCITAAENDDEVARLWSVRRALSPAAFDLKPHKINEDVVVPRTLIPALVHFVEKLSVENGLPIFTFGHAGDGNIHVNIMLDRQKSDEVRRGEQAKTRLYEKVIRLGGTLSGEHGVGVSKAPFLNMELDPVSLAVMRGLKDYFDPQHILNPGKMFPESQTTENKESP